MSGSRLDPYDIPEELMRAYNLTPFKLDILRHMHSVNCDKAVEKWNEAWEFCPSCGRGSNKYGVVVHRGPGESNS